MVSTRFSIGVIVIVLSTVVAPALGADSWSISKLNPFAKKSSSATRARASLSDEPSSSWRPSMSMPSWSSGSQAARKPQQPSTWDRVQQGTKDTYAKTKAFLMPWSNSSKKKSSASHNNKNSTFFTSWFSKPEKPKRSETVKDFLGRPRPSF
jgi:hypothetical protein